MLKNEDSLENYFSRRINNNGCERIVGYYLDRYFYPKAVTEFQRNKIRDTQILGVDMYAISGSTELCVDEKAAGEWVNKYLDTFCLELNLRNKNGEYYDGWLMDEHLINNYMGLIWIDSGTTTNGEITDIQQVTISIVSKDALREWLKARGWTDDKIRTKVKRIRAAVNEYGNDYWKHENVGKVSQYGYKFHCAVNHWEKAVNILLSRKIISDLSLSTYRVTKDGICDAKNQNS